jgi:hypothetical protein
MTEFSQPYHVYWDRDGFYIADSEGNDVTPLERFASMADAEKHLNELEAGEADAHETAKRIADKTIEILRLFGSTAREVTGDVSGLAKIQASRLAANHSQCSGGKANPGHDTGGGKPADGHEDPARPQVSFRHDTIRRN